MAATVSGYRTSSVAVNPAVPLSTLNAIWETAPELLTVAQIEAIRQWL